MIASLDEARSRKLSEIFRQSSWTSQCDIAQTANKSPACWVPAVLIAAFTQSHRCSVPHIPSSPARTLFLPDTLLISCSNLGVGILAGLSLQRFLKNTYVSHACYVLLRLLRKNISCTVQIVDLLVTLFSSSLLSVPGSYWHILLRTVFPKSLPLCSCLNSLELSAHYIYHHV